MKKNRILFVTGARPNLVKLAPIYRYFKKRREFKLSFLHTNQHSNKSLFYNQLKDLNLPFPQRTIKKSFFTSDVEMITYLINKVYFFLKKNKPDYVMVFGDVDSTLATTLAASRLFIPVIHIESGLRSRYLNSKEEINRRVTDKLSKLNFAPTPNALKNLQIEGFKKNSFYVGNIIIENFFNLKNKISLSKILKKLRLQKYEYILITLHRYQNIDNKSQLKKIINKIEEYSSKYKIVFCIHPRTKEKIKNLSKSFFNKKNIIFIDSLPYSSFTKLLINSKIIITDSGGVLEESYFHKKICYIIRDDIERTELINNINVTKIKNIEKAEFKLVKRKKIKKQIIKLWDHKVSSRIFKIIKNKLIN